MRAASIIAGALITLVGALWFFQGLGVVTMEPMLCLADCEPVEGPAPKWVGFGAAAVVAGLIVLRTGLRRKEK